MKKKKIKILIDTVMETAVSSSWMLTDEIKEQLYFNHVGVKYVHDGHEPYDVKLNYVVSRIMFWNTWEKGYYHELVDDVYVLKYLINTWGR
jgi:hypothetical protein